MIQPLIRYHVLRSVSPSFFAALALFLTSSGCATPTHITSQGLRVFDKTGRPDRARQVEEVAKAVAEALGHPERFDGYDVFLVGDWIEIPQMNGSVRHTDGFTNPLDHQLMASVFSDCLYVSGLVHELAHVIHDRPTGVPDWTHDDVDFWQRVEAMEAELSTRCSEEQRRQDEQARAASKPATKAPGDGGEGEQGAKPAGESAPKPATDSTKEAAGESATEVAEEPASEAAAESTSEAAEEPASGAAAESASEPRPGP